MALSNTFKSLYGVAASGFFVPSVLLIRMAIGVAASGLFVSSVLLIRMAIEVNKVLPPRKQIPLIELRYHISEVKRLYEESFPTSALPTIWWMLIAISVSILGVVILFELAQ